LEDLKVDREEVGRQVRDRDGRQEICGKQSMKWRWTGKEVRRQGRSGDKRGRGGGW
jgi:hypothetical protein